MLLPYAYYSSKLFGEKQFQVDPTKPRYQTTNGFTTGPSEHVLNAGQVDIDKPSEPKLEKDGNTPTDLSALRMHLTGLQDDINEFLTEQMEIAKRKKTKIESPEEKEANIRIENEITELLDGGDGDSDEN